MPGKAAKITITERQQETLQAFSHSVTAPSRLRQRATIIVLAFDGLRNSASVNLGDVLNSNDRQAEALEVHRRGLEISRQLLKEVPDEADYLMQQARLLNFIGSNLYKARRPDEALPVVLESRARWAALLGDRQAPDVLPHGRPRCRTAPPAPRFSGPGRAPYLAGRSFRTLLTNPSVCG